MKRLLFVLVVMLVVATRYVDAIPFAAPVAPWVHDHLGFMVAGQAPAGRQANGSRRRGGNDGPVPVLVKEASFADVPVTADALGTIQALNTVTVRSQVDGRLVELAFRDGQDVKRGDVLARIDAATYQAQYDQAVAKKAQDTAQLDNARVDLARYVNLAQGNYGSKQQADTQRAMVAQLEAQARVDQGAIDNARAILDYTTIRAPLDGRTGIRTVDQGNIVHASDAGGIVTITQVRPISVLFNLPQQSLRTVAAAQQKRPLTIQALDADNTTVIATGVVDVIDNQVDATTGTVRIRGTFANDDQGLWPGLFVNIRLFVDTLSHVVVVPTPAVQRGPNGSFVYVLRQDGASVEQRAVTILSQDEARAVVATGLAPPERVVTTGFTRLTDDTQVEVSDGSAPPPPPVANPRARGNGEGGARRRRDQPAGEASQAPAQGQGQGGGGQGQGGGRRQPGAQSQGGQGGEARQDAASR